MQKGWSIPVAQALQRHSGGWRSLPTEEKTNSDDPARSPATEMPRGVANARANAADDGPTLATGARAASAP
jgi:hypothetical protein